MKVLGLVGSGRKDGNTNTLVERILEGARSKKLETKKVFLADLNVEPIGDCVACRRAGKCSKRDDFDSLMDAVLDSDCVIFGTPMYWYGPSAQMKAFIDRWVCRMHFDEAGFRARMKGKKCVLVVPHQDEKLTGANYVLGIMERTFEYMDMALVAKMQTTAWRRQDVSRDEAALRHAFELGAKLTEMEAFKKASGSVTFNFSKSQSES
jgi:multimeric flavodoxin WrbA